MQHQDNNSLFDFIIKTSTVVFGLYLFYKLIVTLFEIAFL